VSSALGSGVPQVGCLGMMCITYKMMGAIKGMLLCLQFNLGD
jgi:hypothetical protein